MTACYGRKWTAAAPIRAILFGVGRLHLAYHVSTNRKTLRDGIVSWQIRKLLTLLRAKSWIWKTIIAGLCGSITHTVLMLGKSKFGILESFQPYQSLQAALGYWTGEYIHPLVPWLLSYLNGSTAAGFAFANLYRHLPGSSALMKGVIAGLLGWLAMDLIFFPLLGLGPFALRLGLGVWPALFSLEMMLAYSVVMSIVYSMIDAELDEGRFDRAS